ncbi:alpha/beta fold hydrolase [Cerasicoccus arenae]|uniref:Haloalkane dehalogenase n=1 Tax=Cerasicoccus arenae TaxID=424488 RepID=A0A8J3DAT1_9BACT|nr:alpha/beta fold hydrolase [Cerasicoccus arenae]MBK1859060.1 alpha/beta fold hydrolase [Cerasicoccus arenae]GHC03409.1 haloalkane dehalogenase [Cerasicoccus arenae]
MADLPAEIRALYPFKSHWLDIPAGRLHYVDEGQGKAVIMLHGNPTWSFFYRDLIKDLRGTHRCIAPDHIGCGLSDKPQDWTYRLQDHIDNVVALVNSLGLESFSLVVHDWGGAIGMGLAEALPSKVKRFVILNTAAFRSQRIPLRIAACKVPVFGEWIVRGLNAFAGPAAKMSVSTPLPPPVKAGFLFPYDSWANRIATHRFVADIPLKPEHPSYAALLRVEEGLAQFQERPMLIVWGQRDFCFNDHFLAEWRKRFPQAATKLFPNAGHYVLEDAGTEARTAITQFLND